MFFSVIIPTRNRPALFKIAVESVLAQQFADFEIVAVNDGSSAEHEAAYRQIESELAGRVSFLHLERSCYGHGQSYAMNMGAATASGRYLCFLDDDDSWTDPEHLRNAAQLLEAADADLYFTNQACYYDGQPTGSKIWLAPLEPILVRLNQPTVSAGAGKAYRVDVPLLLRIDAFNHLNTTIVRRALYLDIKGMDENLYYECDRDVYYREIDRAGCMLFNPVETSRHNIPLKTGTANMTTLISDLEKMLFRLRLLDKTILHARHRELAAVARQHKVYTLKTICEALYRDGRYATAAYYAREALLIGWTLKWSAFALLVQAKSLLYGDRPAGDQPTAGRQ